jgi:hypothetical protein
MPVLPPRPALPPIDDDPYGISRVSGFYGPGAWAAWVIATTFSWLSILRGAHELSYDIIAHLLYTNWAAIDLIRQIRSDEPLVGPVAAAVVVSYWGLLNLYFQHLLVEHDGMSNDGKDVVVLVWMYAGARIVPTLALFIAFIFYFIDDKALVWALAPEMMDTGAMKTHFVAGLVYALMCVWVVFMVLLPRAFTDIKSFVAAPFVIAWTAFPVVCLVGYGVVFVRFIYSRAKEPDCWFLKPCTAQSIADWDQAFALLCALVIVVWAMGPVIYRRVLRSRSPTSA